ncbi:serine protease, partial [Clostridium perfringens]
MDIFERIASYRAEGDRLAWSGTFREFIEILKKDPSPAMTAHARVYDMIESYGFEE